MIQFQIAFGGPILVLTFLYLIYILRKTKLWHHISAVLILVVPLSTYIVFELRNNFLQLRSIALHISQNDEPKNWAIILENRLRGFFIDGTALFPDSYRHFAVLTYLIILIGLYLNRKSKNKNIQVYWLVLFFYVGYWILTLPFSNLVIHYYYWPFLPLFIMCIASMYSVIKKSLFIVVFVLVFGVNFLVGVQSVIESSKVIGKDGSSWLFLDTTIAKVFKDNAEFGYYVYTPDLFAYTPRYAFIYHQRKNPQVKSYSFQKKPITFLYMSPDFDNNTKYHSATWWRANQVRIQSKPAGRIVFPNNQILEKYQLTPQQIGVPSDPNLVSDLFFL